MKTLAASLILVCLVVPVASAFPELPSVCVEQDFAIDDPVVACTPRPDAIPEEDLVPGVCATLRECVDTAVALARELTEA